MLDQIDRACLDRPHDLRLFALAQPVGQLGVEVRRRSERAAGHERGLQPAVAPLDDPLRFRIEGSQLHDLRRERPGERRRRPARGDPSDRCRARCPRSAAAGPARAAGSAPTTRAADPPSSASGSSWPSRTVECAATITSTGSSTRRARPRAGSSAAGTRDRIAPHRPPPTSAGPRGPPGDAPAASRRTFSRNQVIDPTHSTRSAITVAGIDGCSASNARTLASNGENDVGCAGRSYFGGLSDANARSTVARPIPNCLSDLPARNTIRDKPPNQRPILHRDHPPNLSGWPRFRPSLWPQFSNVADRVYLGDHEGRDVAGVARCSGRVQSGSRLRESLGAGPGVPQVSPSILRTPVLIECGVRGVWDFNDLTEFACLSRCDFTLLRWRPLTGSEGSNPSVSAEIIPDQGAIFLPRDSICEHFAIPVPFPRGWRVSGIGAPAGGAALSPISTARSGTATTVSRRCPSGHGCCIPCEPTGGRRWGSKPRTGVLLRGVADSCALAHATRACRTQPSHDDGVRRARLG